MENWIKMDDNEYLEQMADGGINEWIIYRNNIDNE